MKDIHHERRVGHSKKTHRGVSLPIEELVRAIQRNGEEASLVPLEGVLLATLLPYRSGAVTVEDEDHLFVKMFLDLQLFSRRDLANVGIVGLSSPVKVDKCPQPALVIPGRDLDLPYVFDKKPVL